jgi:hypothetical protein
MDGAGTRRLRTAHKSLPANPSLAARMARWLAHFAFILLALAIVGHRFMGLETPAFVAVGALVPLVAIAAIVLAMLGLRRFWRDDVPGVGMSLWAIALGLGLLAPYGVLGWQGATHPMLHDVTTDPADAPRLAGASATRDGPFMNRIRPIGREEAEIMRASYPDMRGRRYDRAAIDVEAKVAELIAERGWRPYPAAVQPPDWPERTFEARAITPILGFPADTAIRVIDEGESTFVDMRSASVYGRHDLGDGATRIVRFLEDLDRRVNEIVLAPAIEDEAVEEE